MPDPSLGQTFFPCSSCGSSLAFKVGTGSLECKYCGNLNEIEESDAQIVELNFNQALREIESVDASKEANIANCINCSAEFSFDQFEHAGVCPFCNASVVTSTKHVNPLKPQAIAPFQISEKQALALFQQWLDKLWFAPNALKMFAKSDETLKGVYLPYWTFDANASSRYSGARGDIYYRNQSTMVNVNGRMVRRVRRVPEIRWTPVSGRTYRFFDDVLVEASKSLPRKITEPLAPWRLDALEPYNKQYVSGFSSEFYQVSVSDGLQSAKHKMDTIIRNDVQRDIGGAQQRIHQLHSSFSDIHFKHIMLPLWTASFTFRNKYYRFAVNGQTGKIKGERPYSKVKIIFFTLMVLIIVGIAIWLLGPYLQEAANLNYGDPYLNF